MSNFQKDGRFKHILQSKIFLVFLSIVIFFFFFNIFSFLTRMEETKKNKEIAEARVLELKKSKEKFSFDINKFRTEKGIEEIVRENYGVVKEGENLIIITEDKNTTEDKKEADSSPFFYFLKNWFK